MLACPSDKLTAIERFLAESKKGMPSQRPPGLPANTFQVAAAALTSATAEAFYLAGGVTAAAAITAWLVLRRRRTVPAGL